MYLVILLCVGLISVRAIVLALHLFHHLLHLFGLFFPLFVAHLERWLEHGRVGLAIAASEAVPDGGVLAKVIVEVQMVGGVAGSAIDDRVIGNVLAVVDQDCPEVDEQEEEDIRDLLKREDKHEHVIGERLGEPVQGVESMRGEWRRHDPLVVRLVEALVHPRVVEAPVDPVYEAVREENEERELSDIIPTAGTVSGGVVQVAVPAHLRKEEKHGAKGH